MTTYKFSIPSNFFSYLSKICRYLYKIQGPWLIDSLEC